MKPETKDWIKRTAGTSALIASPGIVAATLAGGLPVGLLVGGAVAAGNIVGSAAYKKAKEVKEDVENRRRFRELQKHVLAENGILYYQPIVPAPVKGPGDMACKDMSLTPEQIQELKDYELQRQLDFEKAKIDRKYQEKLNFAPNLQALLLRGSGTGDFALSKIIGNTLYGTRVGQIIDKGIALADNVGEGIITRPGHSVRQDFKKLTGFSEENLLSVEEEELKRMKDDVDYTDDPSDKELKKSRYLSMLNSDSRDKFEELLGEKKEDSKTCDCGTPIPPIAMFSESPNLQSIAKGRDFGVFGAGLTGVLTATGLKKPGLLSKIGDKISGIFNNTDKNKALIESATKGMEEAAKKSASNPNGGVINSIFKGAETVVDKSRNLVGKAPIERTTQTAEQAAEKGKEILEASNKQIESVKSLDPSKLTRAQKRVLGAASNSSITANAINKYGVEKVTNVARGVEATTSALTAEQIQKQQAERERNQQQRA